MTTLATPQPFTLDNFEGPVDFLLYLVQKNEIDIYEVPIHEITHQFLHHIEEWVEDHVDIGAEFLSIAASLLLIKSRTLLPRQDQDGETEEDDVDPRFEVIHKLVEYCKFRDLAKDLSRREDEQTGAHYRGIDEATKAQRIPLGLNQLTFEDLATIFQETLGRAASRAAGQIGEEEHRVSDKITEILQRLRHQGSIPIEHIFSADRSRIELIVLFLAILELMKLGEIAVMRDEHSGNIEVTTSNRDQES